MGDAPALHYVWPGDEAVMYGRPCDGFYWELCADGSDIYMPVRLFGQGEQSQVLPDVVGHGGRSAEQHAEATAIEAENPK